MKQLYANRERAGYTAKGTALWRGRDPMKGGRFDRHGRVVNRTYKTKPAGFGKAYAEVKRRRAKSEKQIFGILAQVFAGFTLACAERAKHG